MKVSGFKRISIEPRKHDLSLAQAASIRTTPPNVAIELPFVTKRHSGALPQIRESRN